MTTIRSANPSADSRPREANARFCDMGLVQKSVVTVPRWRTQQASAMSSSDMPSLCTITKGAAHAYNIKAHPNAERHQVEQAESAYPRLVTGWNPRGPRKVRTSATNEVRR